LKKTKLEKIKKIKTIHVWPSLLGFLISVGLVYLLVNVSSNIMLMHTIDKAYAIKFEAAQYIVDMVQSDYEKGMTFPEIVDQMGKTKICITDAEQNVLATNAESKIDFSKEWGTGFTVDLGFLGEEGSLVELMEDGGLRSYFGMDVFNLAMQEHEGSRWLNDEVSQMTCWMIMPQLSEDYHLYIRTEIGIIRRDVIFIAITIGATVIIMLIPLFIMLNNAFSAVKVQRQMRKLLYLDEVTGGNNWIYFKDMAKRELTKSRNRAKSYAIVDLELMKYRSLCACCGVEEGERILENIYNMICDHIGKRDVCTRYARANFALLMECTSAEDAKQKIERIIGELSRNTGRERFIFHAGYYMVNAGNAAESKAMRKKMDIPMLYNGASAARASIASSEESSVTLFTAQMQKEQLWEHKVETEMQDALEKEEFVVYYQPKYNPVTEKLAGAEALIRWQKEDGLVPPGKFIPIFEKNGFITKIDDYMLEHVAKQQAEWLKEGRAIVPVSVNVSRAHFTMEDLAEHILEIVDRYEIPHEYIEIELTESAFFDDKRALLGTVKKLKEYGFEISMDDFGAGYSSLNSLKDLPLDVLKLDADFFRGEDNKDRADIVVTEAINLAKNLGMRIVAEGIEKKNQVDFLAGVGCDMIQGYYFAKPMPAADYEERM